MQKSLHALDAICIMEFKKVSTDEALYDAYNTSQFSPKEVKIRTVVFPEPDGTCINTLLPSPPSDIVSMV